MMDSLVATAIHDAKNSLNTLGVWLTQVRHELAAQAPGAASVALEQAESLTTRLAGQLVELLVLYRAGEGSLRMTVEDHQLSEFLADLMAEFAVVQAHADGINIETDFSAAERLGSWAFDAYLVKFVLLDALRNALRHAKRNVRFGFVQCRDGGIRFIIEDDGEGYPDALLHEASVDAHMAATYGSTVTGDGTGLGLRFANLIANRHAVPGGQSGTEERRGRLELVNDGFGTAQGARFTLILP